MRRLIVALSLAALPACTPAAGGPEAVVRSIYVAAQQNVGDAITPDDAIPMSDGLRSLLDRAEAAATARNEPFIEGDLALDCQDCRSVGDLVVGPQTGAEQEPAADGHQWVQAAFKLNGDEDRIILWDMVQTARGWRVDDIVTGGASLRAEAQRYLAEAPATATPALTPTAPP